MENRTFACENAEQLIKLILSRRSYRGMYKRHSRAVHREDEPPRFAARYE